MFRVGHHELRRGSGRCLTRVSGVSGRAGHQAFLHAQMRGAQEGEGRDVGLEVVWMKGIIEVLRVLRERKEKKKRRG